MSSGTHEHKAPWPQEQGDIEVSLVAVTKFRIVYRGMSFHACVHALSLSRVQLLVTLWTVAHQASLCPWNSAGRNIGAGCHFLLQGIFLIQGLNPHL